MNTDRGTSRGALRWPALLALAGTVVFTAGLHLYARHGQALLARGDNGVSRLFAGEADRLAAAGSTEEALALYDKAFRAGFGYPPDKSRALARKGLLLWRMGRVKEAAETLSASVSGSAPNFEGAPELVEALLHLRRIDEAQSVVRRWRESFKKPGKAQAAMLCAAGRVAEERGDRDSAMTLYGESADASTGTEADYRLGLLCASANQKDEACAHLERFLLGGGSGNDAARARELFSSLAATATPPK